MSPAMASGSTPRISVTPTSGVIPLTLIFTCLTLWDFYIGEVRIFDFIGLAFAGGTIGLIALLSIRSAPRIDPHAVWPLMGVFLLILAYALIGISNHPDNLKPSLGIMFGVLVLTLSRSVVIEDRVVSRCIRYVAVLHLAAFFFQLAYFYGTREVLNYHAIVGLQPRLLSSVFRPAGLFLEPAIYCFFASSIFLLRRRSSQQFSILDALLLTSMVLSLSLWGILSAVVLLFAFKPRVSIAATLAMAAAGVLFLTVKGITFQEISDSTLYRFFSMRLTDLGGDASTQQRYGGTIAMLAGAFGDARVLFGNGLNNFFEEFGSNGWSFILNSMGITGTALLFLFLVLLAPPRRWIVFLFGVGLLLTAAPLWKTFYFWCWMALMLRQWNEQATGAVTRSAIDTWQRSANGVRAAPG